MGNDNAFNKYQNSGLDRDEAVRQLEFRRKTDEERAKGGQIIVVNEEEFNLPMTMRVKPYMDQEEERVFIGALHNWKHGLITVECLALIAQNPGHYTSMGLLIPAVAVAPIRTYPEINITNDDPTAYHQSEVERNLKLDVALTSEIRKTLGYPPAPPSIDEVIASAVEMDAMKKMPEITINSGDPELQKLWFDNLTKRLPKSQYNGVSIIDICEELDFNRGTAVNLIANAGFEKEDTEVPDLEKALWYVERELARDYDEHSLGDLDRVVILVQQMNYHRGNAVWSIAGAGRVDTRNTARWDLKDAARSITAEIKRLKELAL